MTRIDLGASMPCDLGHDGTSFVAYCHRHSSYLPAEGDQEARGRHLVAFGPGRDTRVIFRIPRQGFFAGSHRLVHGASTPQLPPDDGLLLLPAADFTGPMHRVKDGAVVPLGLRSWGLSIAYRQRAGFDCQGDTFVGLGGSAKAVRSAAVFAGVQAARRVHAAKKGQIVFGRRGSDPTVLEFPSTRLTCPAVSTDGLTAAVIAVPPPNTRREGRIVITREPDPRPAVCVYVIDLQ